MPKLTFTDSTPQTLILSATSEIFTNCKIVNVDKQLCDADWYINYLSLDSSRIKTLPAGTYRFTPILNGACQQGCWVCALSSESPTISLLPICLENPATQICERGVLRITNGDVAGAERLLLDGTPVPTTYELKTNCGDC